MNTGDKRLLRGWYDLKYLFGDKWAPAIVVTLSGGPMRRKELFATISSYSIGKEWSDKHVPHDSILARTLKKMTEEGLVTRTSDTTSFPHRVYYTLNPDVSAYLELANVLLPWVDAHPELIAQAQAYARRNSDGNGSDAPTDAAALAALDTSDDADEVDEADEDTDPEDSVPVRDGSA